MNISTTEYQRLAYRTAKQFGDIKLDLIHAAIGAGSEVGELAEVPLRASNGEVIQGSLVWFICEMDEKFRPNCVEELGDIAWYLALAATVIGADFGEMFHQEHRDNFFQLNIERITYQDCTGALMMLTASVGDLNTMVKGIFCYGKELNSLALQMKVRDAFYCLLLMAETLRIDWTVIGTENIAKLRKRYPDKYNDVDAVARADKLE